MNGHYTDKKDSPREGQLPTKETILDPIQYCSTVEPSIGDLLTEISKLAIQISNQSMHQKDALH